MHPNSVNIVFVGSANAGKSALIKKMSKPGSKITQTKANSSFWTRQYEGDTADVKTSLDGVEWTAALSEVRGSRGRSSNYRSLLGSFENADGVVVAIRAGTSKQAIERDVKYYRRIMRVARATMARREAGTDKDKLTSDELAAMESANTIPPVLVCVTQTDANVEEEEEEEDPDHENEDQVKSDAPAPIFRTSAVEGTNIAEALDAIVGLARDHKAKLASPAAAGATEDEEAQEAAEIAAEVAMIDKLTAPNAKLALPQVFVPNASEIAVAL